MATNPYNLTTNNVNKSDKKIITTSQRMIGGRNDNTGLKSNSPHQQHNYVKSKADYLYSGSNSSRYREQ